MSQEKYKRCGGCSRNCIIAVYANTAIPSDSLEPVPGKTPEGQEIADIRPYCLANFIPAPDA